MAEKKVIDARGSIPQEIGAKAEDIFAMVAHRAEKPNGFPFGGFVKIGLEEMIAILALAVGL